MVLLQIIGEIKKLTLSDYLVFMIAPILISYLFIERKKSQEIKDEKINSEEVMTDIALLATLSIFFAFGFKICAMIFDCFIKQFIK